MFRTAEEKVFAAVRRKRMNEQRKVIGIDVGGTNIRTGLVNEQKKLSDFERKSSQEVFSSSSASDGLAMHLLQYMKDHDLHREDIAAVSIGFPSTLDPSRRIVASTPNIACLNNVPVADRLEEALHIPVFLNKDVNMLMLYDMYQMELPEKGIVTGFYIGTGIGNAISINGDLLYGDHGVAAELGHIPVMGRTELCGCGNEGCIELYASGKYLAELCRKKFPGIHIGDIYEKCPDEPDVLEFVSSMALPIASEINILDPGYVILGGGILQMKGFPKEKLEAEIRRHARKPYPEKGLEFFYSQPSQENGVIGAGIYAYSCL